MFIAFNSAMVAQILFLLFTSNYLAHSSPACLAIFRTKSDTQSSFYIDKIASIIVANKSPGKKGGPLIESTDKGSVYVGKIDAAHDYAIFNRSIYFLSADGRIGSANLPNLNVIRQAVTPESLRDHGDLRLDSIEFLGEPNQGQRMTAFEVTKGGVWFVGEANGAYGIGRSKHKTLDIEQMNEISISEPVTGMKMMPDGKTLMLATGSGGINIYNTQTGAFSRGAKINIIEPGRWLGSTAHSLDILNISQPQNGKVQVQFYSANHETIGAVWLPIKTLSKDHIVELDITRDELARRLRESEQSLNSSGVIFEGIEFFSAGRIKTKEAALLTESFSLASTRRFYE